MPEPGQCFDVRLDDRLQFDDDDRILSQISGEPRVIESHPVPFGSGVEIKRTTTTSIDTVRVDGYRFCRASELKKLEVGPNASPRNYAIKTYINALPDDLIIVLYWC